MLWTEERMETHGGQRKSTPRPGAQTEPTYGDLAYDLDAMSRESALRHAGEAARREAVACSQGAAVSRQLPGQAAPHLSLVSCWAFWRWRPLAVLTAAASYVQLTVISADVVTLQSELSELQTENVSLTAQYEQIFDLDTIEGGSGGGRHEQAQQQPDLLHRSVRARTARWSTSRQEPGVLERGCWPP